MNDYSWLMRVFVQLPTFHLILKGNHLLRWATANFFRGLYYSTHTDEWVR